jgi:hypothetical protein
VSCDCLICRETPWVTPFAQIGNRKTPQSIGRPLINIDHLRHSRLKEPVPNQHGLSDLRRQPIADIVYLRRDGGAEIVIKSAERKVRHPVFKGLREDL